MDEEKKPESGGEPLGPYLLHEQLEQDEPGRGELYRATHETTGATALVLKPSGDGPLPLGEWQVRCVCSASPGYLALEVERSSWSRTPDRHWVEGLVFTLEDVHEAMRRMARALPTYEEPRPWWRLGGAVAGAAAVCALLFVLLRPAPVSPPPAGPVGAGTGEERPDTFSDGALYDTPLGPPGLARPLPREPFKGQKRPPCTRYAEEELVGACWVLLEVKAPCPESLYEHQGKCYLPIFSARPPPQSLTP
jgi:hypothetical protein